MGCVWAANSSGATCRSDCWVVGSRRGESSQGFDLALGTHRATDGNGCGELDQPGGEVPEAGDVPQDMELAKEDQTGQDVSLTPGFADLPHHDPGHCG